ncbi:3'-kinase [Devosia neptuniae]|uniref:3'-kinase n=1 Tax=Devosia neptuniae TaxID=191302 RepID=A0ABY6CFI4_9HYPH|nr:aminoglycoside phosphotransferase family protein [Devosia neptuniae]UXN70995.1 3'-kinase [Devosia neptuniae]
MVSEEVFQPWLSRWGLVPEGEAIRTHSSLLLPVQREGVPAMLKIATAEEELNGAHLMAWYAGNGAARVFAHEDSGLLLERLSGHRSLIEMERSGRGDEATGIICAVVAKLHAARNHMPPETLYPMAIWFRQLEPAATRLGGVLTKSAAAARELLAMPQYVVPLHGDIHHGNILDGDERGWLAIDPKGLLGERAFDYANLFCHPEAKIATEAGRLEQRIDIVARDANLDPKRVLKWILAYAGLKSVWTMEREGGGQEARELTIAQMAAAALGL